MCIGPLDVIRVERRRWWNIGGNWKTLACNSDHAKCSFVVHTQYCICFINAGYNTVKHIFCVHQIFICVKFSQILRVG